MFSCCLSYQLSLLTLNELLCLCLNLKDLIWLQPSFVVVVVVVVVAYDVLVLKT